MFVRWMELHCAQPLSRHCSVLPLPRHRYGKAPYHAVASLSSSSPASSPPVSEESSRTSSSLLAKLRVKKLKDVRSSSAKSSSTPPTPSSKKKSTARPPPSSSSSSSPGADSVASSFKDLPLSDELMAAVDELGLTQPTEVQCRSIPAIVDGQSVVMASHTGSGKTLAYMIPIVQCLKQDELHHDKATRPRRPRAVVLCPTRELAEQVFRVAKSLCHHAKFRVTMVGGGVRLRPQEDALNAPLDMLVGTPGRLLKHVEDGNVAYGDIKYVVLDEADTMFDRGFGPDVKKLLGPLRNRSKKPESLGFQTVLVTATITPAVQKLMDEEFPGIKHIRTSTLHKKISSARHMFIKLASTENKLESLLQVLEPSLSKNERVMVFCNTLGSCRAVDHFLSENNIPTVNYHGAVPAEERVEGLQKFRSADKNCPTLVCTDLAARGLDLIVDHVIMFDFPLNSIDYLHRTGRTARMGAKGRVTSLVSKRSLALAELIEEAIHKGETLECVSSVRKAATEVKKQPTKAKVQDKSKKTKTTFPHSKGVKKSSIMKSTTQSASTLKRPVVVISKSKKSRVVQVAKDKSPKKSGNQTLSKRIGQKAMRPSGKR